MSAPHIHPDTARLDFIEKRLQQAGSVRLHSGAFHHYGVGLWVEGSLRASIDRVAGDAAAPPVADALAEWLAAGGEVHGPNVETVTMPLSKYREFRASLGAAPVAVPDGWAMVESPPEGHGLSVGGVAVNLKTGMVYVKHADGENWTSGAQLTPMTHRMICKYRHPPAPQPPAQMGEEVDWRDEADRLATVIELALGKMREPHEYLSQALREHRALATHQPKGSDCTWPECECSNGRAECRRIANVQPDGR